MVKQLESLPATDDIKVQLVSNKTVDKEQVTAQCMTKYADLCNRIQGTIDAQDGACKSILSCNDVFIKSKSSSPELANRERYLTEVNKVLSLVDDLRSNVREGCQFYGDLLARVQQLLQTATDYSMGRGVEKKELIMSLHEDHGMSNLSISGGGHSGAPPAASAYGAYQPTNVAAQFGGGGHPGGGNVFAPTATATATYAVPPNTNYWGVPQPPVAQFAGSQPPPSYGSVNPSGYPPQPPPRR
jgi:hypothetical protein